MDAVSVRVPYRNLREDAAEVELVGLDESHLYHQYSNHRLLHQEDHNGVEFGDKSNRVSSNGGNHSSDPEDRSSAPPPPQTSLLTLILSCTVAAGVQFGWALQLSLLTPYIQVCFVVYIWVGPLVLDFYRQASTFVLVP